MAGYSVFRFLRFLRSMCAPITALIGFSCLLTFIFILYQPTPGPGEIQQMGWQSWDIVAPFTGSEDDVIASPGKGSPSPGNVPAGTDWWNVTDSGDDEVDTASFPLDKWNPLLPHDTGLSELAITRCMFNPNFAKICAPKTTIEQDAIKGKWVLVDRNLNREGGMWNLNLYYRRTRRLDIPLINDLLLLPADTEPSTPAGPGEKWEKVDRSIRDGVMREPPLFLWYKTGQTLREMTVKGAKHEIITEIDVMYGPDRPWYGFTKMDPPTMEETAGRIEATWLAYRKGVKKVPKAPPLHFSRDGHFKVMQIADLHYSVAHGTCRDTLLTPCDAADNMTNSLLARAIEAERPDLVVFTGDQLNGQGTSWDARSVLAKFSRAAEEARVPWAAVYGNHDDEGADTKEMQTKMMKALPYSLVEEGPKDVHGVSNYVLKVKSADPSMTHLLTLYFLDSGSYEAGILDFWGFFKPTDYDYIRQSQINWFLQESGSIGPIERPFHPDTDKDFGDLWKRQSASQITGQGSRLAKPNAMMFFHMPMQEAYNKPDLDPSTHRPLDVGLHDTESKGSSKKNDGFFEKGILKAMESDHRAGGNSREVKVIGNGHSHITENCRRIKGVWMCFGGGGSYAGYGKIGFDRRFRIYDVSDYGETIRTYKRTEHDEIVDEMVLVGTGAPGAYEGT